MVMLENLKAKLKATPKWDLHLFLTTEDFIELCVQTLSWAFPLFQSIEKWILTWKKWIGRNCSAWWILGCTNVFGFFPLCLSFSFLLTFIFNASFSKCISNFILLVCSLNNTLETESIEKDMNDMWGLAHHVKEMEKEAHINIGQKKLDDCVFENQSRVGVKYRWVNIVLLKAFIHSVHATLQ